MRNSDAQLLLKTTGKRHSCNMLSGFANTNTAIKRSQGLQNFSIKRLKVKTMQYVTHELISKVTFRNEY